MVLPLLQNEVVATGWVSEQDFLTGFALVQAMPGPLFNFAAYLGELSALSRASNAPKTLCCCGCTSAKLHQMSKVEASLGNCRVAVRPPASAGKLHIGVIG